MRPSDIARTLKSLIPTRRPVYLWGPPGVGKSSCVHQAVKDLGLMLVDLRAVLLDPVDLRGLPSIRDGRAHWCPPSFFPHAGEGVIFADELAQAPPLVQAGFLQLTLDRKIGDYELPSGWTVLAASNRQEDRAGTHKLISPLLNRFIHLDLEVSHEDWMAWAIESGVPVEVRAFLNFKPGLLFDFNPASGARAFPTPRSWAFVGEVLPYTPQDLLFSVVAGTVGEGPAAEFTAFCEIFQKLPDPDAVLEHPTQAKVPDAKAVSVLYALVGALSERMR
ncbi:MAG: ATP-binding protein, partial [Phycisphaerales bacterium]